MTVPARADFNKWALRDTWHITEGAMLILGFEPYEIKTDWWPPPDPPPRFLDICDTARRSRGVTLKGDEVSPPDFLAWARKKEYRVPRKLEEAVNRFHPKAEGRPQGATAGPKWPWGSHETELLRHLAAAADRWWKNYDPSNPTTAPKNQEVIDWLKKQGVAERNAQVMATILRADNLPTGPRT
jgi:hypothetical protein